MDILSSLGQMYMFILLVLLFIGSGIAAWAFINNLASKNNPVKPGVIDKSKMAAAGSAPSKAPGNITLNNKPDNNKPVADKKAEGFKITDGRWYKLVVYSLLGILLSVTLLGFAATNSNSSSAHNHSDSQSAMNGMQAGYMPVNNMQGGMNGNMPMNGYMPSNNMMPANNGTHSDYMLMQQFYMMQQQINNMQQMLNMQMQMQR